MAKKARKAAAKRGKKSKAKKTKAKTKARSKRAGIGQRLSRGYRIVVDTVTGTEKLRVKMEKPGTDETE